MHTSTVCFFLDDNLVGRWLELEESGESNDLISQTFHFLKRQDKNDGHSSGMAFSRLVLAGSSKMNIQKIQKTHFQFFNFGFGVVGYISPREL